MANVQDVAHTRYTFFLPPGGGGGANSAYFHFAGSRFRDTGGFSKFPIWAWNLELKKGPKVTYVLSFYPSGWKLSLFSHYGQPFSRFSKFPYFSMKSELEKRSQSCICTLFLPRVGGSNLSLSSLYRQPFSRYGASFKISIFGHEMWNLKKCRKIAYVLYFYPRGWKLSLFSLYGQPFSRYGPSFKISIFGHEIWKLKIGRKVAYRHMDLHMEVNFLRYGPIFKISFILGMKSEIWRKVPELHMYSLPTP